MTTIKLSKKQVIEFDSIKNVMNDELMTFEIHFYNNKKEVGVKTYNPMQWERQLSKLNTNLFFNII